MVTMHADMLCVTRWSKLVNDWDGVAFRTIAELAHPQLSARFITFHCDGGYTTNVPLDVGGDDDVVFAMKRDGEVLSPDHGYPLRAVIPMRYAWKSAKWIRAVEFMTEDRLGYWERYGYSNSADF